MDIKAMAVRVAGTDPLINQLSSIILAHEGFSPVLAALHMAFLQAADTASEDGIDQVLYEKMLKQAGMIGDAIDSILPDVEVLDKEIAAG